MLFRSRYGYEQAAARIQELYLAGKREDAIAAVPDALADEVSLCGPPERIRERLAAWRAAGKPGRRTSIRNQLLHSMYLEDAAAHGLGDLAADTGFGNTSYRTQIPVVYSF